MNTIKKNKKNQFVNQQAHSIKTLVEQIPYAQSAISPLIDKETTGGSTPDTTYKPLTFNAQKPILTL